MNDRTSAPRPASWPGRIRGMFNLHDPRWGRDDEPSGQEPGQRPDEPQRPPPRGQGPQAGPPDLDELWRDFNRKLGGLFGGGRGRGRNPYSGGGMPPEMKGRGAGIGIGVIAAVALAIWLASGVFIVREGEQAVVTTFGRFDGIRKAGLNWRMPYPIQRHETVRVTQIRSVDVGRDSIIRSTGLRESAMLTQDENIVEIKFAVQYRLNDARAYLFESKSPDDAVVQAAESAVREVVGKMTMDTAMAEERDQIAPRVRDLMQAILDRYQVGIEVVAVNMQQGGVRPPEQVQAAFDDVLKAGQERERVKNEAQAYANDVVPRAVGTAARLKQEAEGYKARIVAQAQGDAQRFSSVLSEYQKAPQVTRERMYLDAMQQIYGGVNKIIIDSRAGGNLMYLPLDKLLQGAAGAGAAAGAAPAAAQAPAPATAPAAPAADPRARDNARTRERETR
ncbi:MAG TPA: FtsH protease activity modulator HflK [Ottowia sp.]|uniref:FtsH protease activity modulator HflK n=1 Tax=Ottowia sp. TaxID=1898956 RepID=UPI002CD5EF02|nr:FtsH protease activity modulator HflK [Ottowia sp.]HNR82699.1 FtsH protease activity modulator HflK [Ottowia sp.]HNT83720.1 FtsH protease activity modulator HflK [Ottowia sp.]HOZ92606.1 FtsH protease activity modulator HflK [Ottowia sp.]HQO53426.1 FtsH protease activity modulator HflK [Ottowia sp.]HQQ53233.1 FtsH protease activity modulator HflK [Ottowia sp.]